MRFCGFLNLFGMIFLLAQLSAASAADTETRLLRQPAVSKDHLAFVYGGDIWIATATAPPHPAHHHPASEFAPHFSPDGKWIAFSADYDNNIDVYVVPRARRPTAPPDMAPGRRPRHRLEPRRQAGAVRLRPRGRQQPQRPALRSAAERRLREARS